MTWQQLFSARHVQTHTTSKQELDDLRRVVMMFGEVPMTAVAGNLRPPRAIHGRTSPTIVITPSSATLDPGKTGRAASPNESPCPSEGAPDPMKMGATRFSLDVSVGTG